MARNNKTYKKQYKKQYKTRRSSRNNVMRGGTIVGDLKNNFLTLKNNFTNNVTTQVKTKLSLYKIRAMERFNKAKNIFTRKINCFKS